MKNNTVIVSSQEREYLIRNIAKIKVMYGKKNNFKYAGAAQIIEEKLQADKETFTLSEIEVKLLKAITETSIQTLKVYTIPAYKKRNAKDYLQKAENTLDMIRGLNKKLGIVDG